MSRVWGYGYFWVYSCLVNGAEADNTELVVNFPCYSCLAIEKALSTSPLALVGLIR